MKRSEMKNLIRRLADCVERHGIDAIDTDARSMCVEAGKLNAVMEQHPSDFDAFLDAIEKANLHVLS